MSTPPPKKTRNRDFHRENNATMRKNEPSANENIGKAKTAIRALNCVKFCWHWLNKHEVISGFVVTILGVWAAFELAGWGEQNTLDRATQNRLHLVVIEAQYNGTAAKDILDSYADANNLRINLSRLDSASTLAAFQDSNVFQFLPTHKVSLLRTYVNNISSLNQSLLVHQGVLETQNYRRTTQEKEAREKVRENAAAAFSMSQVLLEELKEYDVDVLFDRKEADRIENRSKLIKDLALKGQVSLSRED